MAPVENIRVMMPLNSGASQATMDNQAEPRLTQGTALSIKVIKNETRAPAKINKAAAFINPEPIIASAPIGLKLLACALSNSPKPTKILIRPVNKGNIYKIPGPDARPIDTS